MLLVAALLVASCGTRLNADEQAFYAGAGSSGVPTAETEGGGGNGSPSGSRPTTDSRVLSDGGGEDEVADARAPSGSATETDAGAASGAEGDGAPTDVALPCAAPSSEVGVTDETLTLGGVFQLSGLLPGFAQTAVYGAQAYVEYLNANGGLCGRQVEYVVLDDAFDASRNADQTASLMKRAVSLVGGFSAADNGGAGVLQDSNVLDIAVGTTPARQAVPTHYPIVGPENPADPGGSGTALPEYRYSVEKGATKMAIVYVGAAAGRSTAVRIRNDARAAGMEIVLELEVQPTQFSYASTARAVADSGAQMLVSLLEINGSVQMAEEMARVDHDVVFPYYRLGYDQRFLDQAGDAANGAVNFLEFLPFEEGGTNEALDNFLAYFDQVAPGEAPTFQAINGWIAMELYTQVIRRLDGAITRDALVDAAAGLGEVDAKGLFAPFDFASRVRPACKVIVRAVDGRYQREAPDSGFYC